MALVAFAVFCQSNIYFAAGCFFALPHIVRLIPYAMYDLVGEKREKMYLALNERRAMIAAQQSGETV